jgi:voltage-gated potassium channel
LREKIDKLSSSLKSLFIHGDPTEDNILISAGIKRAKGIFLSLPTDEANLFITITARSLNPDIRIVAKGIDVKSHSKIIKAGANAAVSPTSIGGMRMVSEMVRPTVVTFLDMMLRERKINLRVEEVTIQKGAHLDGKTVEESKISEKTGSLLVAISRSGSKDYEFNPPKEKVIKEDDILILIASPESVKQVDKLAGGD